LNFISAKCRRVIISLCSFLSTKKKTMVILSQFLFLSLVSAGYSTQTSSCLTLY
jgi:uncharacterized membrane protein